jgi:hypothetical protein
MRNFLLSPRPWLRGVVICFAVAGTIASSPLGEEAKPEIHCGDDIYGMCDCSLDASDVSEGTPVDTCSETSERQCCYSADPYPWCRCAPLCSLDEYGSECSCSQGYFYPNGSALSSCSTADIGGGVCCVFETTCTCRFGECSDQESQVSSCEPLSASEFCVGQEAVEDCVEDPSWPTPDPDEGGGGDEDECSSDSDCGGCNRCSSGSCSPCAVSPSTGECMC